MFPQSLFAVLGTARASLEAARRGHFEPLIRRLIDAVLASPNATVTMRTPWVLVLFATIFRLLHAVVPFELPMSPAVSVCGF